MLIINIQNNIKNNINFFVIYWRIGYKYIIIEFFSKWIIMIKDMLPKIYNYIKYFVDIKNKDNRKKFKNTLFENFYIKKNIILICLLPFNFLTNEVVYVLNIEIKNIFLMHFKIIK